MNDSRLENFTDGILVIIFTIMVLDFKVPNSSHLTSILVQFPYFISYTVSWLFLGVACYNHYFIFGQLKRVTQKVFWANNFWLFTSSFIPLATAWIGNNLTLRGPEIFYGLVFFIWSFSFIVLVKTVINDNEKLGRHKNAQLLRRMSIYRYLTSFKFMLIQTIVWILILIFIPQFQLIIMVWQIMVIASKTNFQIDQLKHKHDTQHE